MVVEPGRSWLRQENLWRFGVLLGEVAVEAADHEAMAVGIDEVAGNVLAQGGRGRLKPMAPVRQNGISAQPTTDPTSSP